jgi:hypothetical protein
LPSPVSRRSTVRIPDSAPSTSRAGIATCAASSSTKSSVGWLRISVYNGCSVSRSIHRHTRGIAESGASVSGSGGRLRLPALASTSSWRSITQIRALVRDKPWMICPISADGVAAGPDARKSCGAASASGAPSSARCAASDSPAAFDVSNKRGRSCSAVATA